MDSHFLSIDADGHLEENHIDWKDRLPEKYKWTNARHGNIEREG